MPEFKTSDAYRPTGDQPTAIAELSAGLEAGERYQTMLGATGTGKTATMAWIVEQVQRPTLLIAHNKTLAAQLCNELREFFPDNAVEYFVSYYDYYQPEAYGPQADLYIEKDSSRNDDIDRLRHAATAALLSRRDVIIVASVSCIYGLGSPEEYEKRVVLLAVGEEHDRDLALRKLVDIQYARNDTLLGRGRFRVKGDVVEVQPAHMESAYRISFFGDEVEQITHFDPLTGEVYGKVEHLALFPATQYVTSKPTIERAAEQIRHELEEQVKMFESSGKMLEAHRIRQRTEYDLEMMQELGFCSGIENYSRHLDGRAPGTAPHTLLDFFPSDFVIFVDESHQTVPQLGGMYEGDRSRKETLVDHGFRLPSALDNRPLRFDEFLGRVPQLVFVNLLREGLDLPEVSLVAVLDADKEGFLRGKTALIQTIGRAARNVNGKVLLYADKLTEAIQGALEETNRRREKQLAYNEEHGITPESIVKGVSDIAEFLALESPTVPGRRRRGRAEVEGMSPAEMEKLVIQLEEEMFAAAEELRFEYAAKLRDEIKDLRRELQAAAEAPA